VLWRSRRRSFKADPIHTNAQNSPLKRKCHLCLVVPLLTLCQVQPSPAIHKERDRADIVGVSGDIDFTIDPVFCGGFSCGRRLAKQFRMLFQRHACHQANTAIIRPAGDLQKAAPTISVAVS
jgi:hypothetical protein